MNNSLYLSQEYQEVGGAVYLQSELKTEIIDCFFMVILAFFGKKNYLEKYRVFGTKIENSTHKPLCLLSIH